MLADRLMAFGASYLIMGFIFGVIVHLWALHNGKYQSDAVHPLKLVVTCTLFWPLIFLGTAMQMGKRG